ncbi:type IX secretion system protein PorD [Ulvibacter litoralis]|uniref:DUF4835 domain-containing protein n=1 Tax=Ulvibacter litoralis TaxID=227084 RepID=A0A1G7EM07_9FLAO|nr:DUF4835 family protein [Ulvibacter litoralis]GHC54588.1 DUF4835 domain-containing protein [Ulvibacter litoralis]SDE64718.1 protein of unknown function [Ulvibacter litoralis]
MRSSILFIAFIVGIFTVQAQELNSTVIIDAEQTGQSNQQIFKTLEQQLTEFINNRSWTNKEYKNQERIDCSFTLIVSEYDGTNFTASLQVGATRPVFNSTYDSPIYNYNDRQVSFMYKEFEPLTFNINTFDSNLVSVIAYHVYTIIGLDADSFELNGGDAYFAIAKQIVGTAASSNYSGWKPTDGTQSRYQYNNAILSNVYKEFHTAMYDYHRVGLDVMESKPKEAKVAIIGAIKTLKGINDRRPNSYLLRTFFDAKSEEIQAIFSGGPRVDIAELVENLTRMAPTKRSNWNEIKL